MERLLTELQTLKKELTAFLCRAAVLGGDSCAEEIGVVLIDFWIKMCNEIKGIE